MWNNDEKCEWKWRRKTDTKQQKSFAEPIGEFHHQHGVKTTNERSARDTSESFPIKHLALKAAGVFVPRDFNVSCSRASRASRTLLTIMQRTSKTAVAIAQVCVGLAHLKRAYYHAVHPQEAYPAVLDKHSGSTVYLIPEAARQTRTQHMVNAKPDWC